MGGRRLNDVGMPIENHQASNKFYVDTVVEAATKDYADYVDYVDNVRSHIIAVHANYYGRLEKDNFQFTFGGNTIQPNVNNINNRFLMPQSGRI